MLYRTGPAKDEKNHSGACLIGGPIFGQKGVSEQSGRVESPRLSQTKFCPIEGRMEIRRQKFAAKEKQIRGSMIENNGDHRQSKFDRVKISSALLHRILKLSTKEYEVFVELGQGRELDEIAPRLKKQLNSVYVMVQRMRPKLGIKTLAMLRFEATRYLLSGIERQDLHFVHFVFPQEQKLSSAA